MARELPLDNIFSIAEFLSIKDGLSLLCVCQSWYELDGYEIVWKTLLSNYIQLKIQFYRELGNSDDGEGNSIKARNNRKKKQALYNRIVDHLKKFHQSQIVKEKSVNAASFAKYRAGGNESSSVLGMRFKKLAESAIVMHYNLIMANGLTEIKDSFTFEVINYEHRGYCAGVFLNEAKKFTSNGRVYGCDFAMEYWKRCSTAFAELISLEVGRTMDDYSKVLDTYLNNFKPILNDRIVENICTSYWHTDNEPVEDNLMESLLRYLSIEGNFEKSNDPFIDFNRVTRFTLRMKYVKKIFNVIYPNQWIFNIRKILKCHNKGYFELFQANKDETPEDIVEKLSEFLQVEEKDSIDFTQLKSYHFLIERKEKDIIDLLSERGLITPHDLKVIFHTFNYEEKIPHLLPKIENFDPYEIIQTSKGPTNFLKTYFSEHSHYSIYKFLQPFFNSYPEKIDLDILSKGGISVRSNINSCIVRHFLDYLNIADAIVESIDMMNNKFNPPLDVSTIEAIAKYFEPYYLKQQNGYEGLTNQHMADGFKHALQQIHHQNVPFEQYCESIRYKYATDVTHFESYQGDERMVYLYNLCQRIIQQMPTFFRSEHE